MQVRWQLLAFEALTPHAVHDIMRLRQAVFIIEQGCIYPDLDGIDPQCLHLIGWHDNELVACLRIIPPNIDASGCPTIGRICTATSARGLGLGRELVARALRIVDDQYPGVPCHVIGQSHLRRFYEAFGFVVSGDEYDDGAGIPLVPMMRPAS